MRYFSPELFIRFNSSDDAEADRASSATGLSAKITRPAGYLTMSEAVDRLVFDFNIFAVWA